MTPPDRIRNLAMASALAVALSGCGDSGEDAAQTAPAPAATPAPASAPDGGAAATAASDPAAGRLVYQTYCAVCHGESGDGQTPFAQALDPPPTAHRNGAYMNTLSDDYLFQVIEQGGAALGKSPSMAPWGGSLGDAQIRDVVAFIRSLADPPYRAPAP